MEVSSFPVQLLSLGGFFFVFFFLCQKNQPFKVELSSRAKVPASKSNWLKWQLLMSTVTAWLSKTQFKPTNNGHLVAEEWLPGLGQPETNKLVNNKKKWLKWALTGSASYQLHQTKCGLHSTLDSFSMLQRWKGREICKLLKSQAQQESTPTTGVLSVFYFHAFCHTWSMKFQCDDVSRHAMVKVGTMQLGSGGQTPAGFGQWDKSQRSTVTRPNSIRPRDKHLIFER